MSQVVRILNGSLDELNGSIVIRGRIDSNCLDQIQVDDYQREVLPISTIRQIMDGFKKNDSSVPDVDLGMRGEQAEEGKDGTYLLKDPVYVVDGLQRISAAKQFRLEGGIPRMGATIHLNTTRDWEVERFKILNANRSKLSPNVLLRNAKDKFEVVATLLAMSDVDDTFVMRNRICWSQRAQRSQLITAMSFLRVVGVLHSHLGATGANALFELVPGVQKIYEKVGRNIFRGNVRAFFNLIDECWGIKTVAFKEGASYLRLTFMGCLAKVLSNHDAFWREDKLFIEADLVRKLKGFPVSDPTIRQLSSSGGQAHKLLYALFVDHLNRGKRNRRLVPRTAYADDLPEMPTLVEDSQ